MNKNMKKYVIIAFGVCMAATANVNADTVIAKSNHDTVAVCCQKARKSKKSHKSKKSSKYKQKVKENINTPEDAGRQALLEDCRLTEGDVENILNAKDNLKDSIFSDEFTSVIVQHSVQDGKIVLDLGKMADQLNDGLGDGQGNLFNNGVLIKQSYEDSKIDEYYCICTESDFKDMVKSQDGEWGHYGNDETFYYNLTLNDDGDIIRKRYLSYDADSHIMSYTYMNVEK